MDLGIGDLTPGNVRWAIPLQQQRNKERRRGLNSRLLNR